MKMIPVILFIVGVLLEIGAFLVAHSEYLPVALRFISPSYARAMTGVETFNRTKKLDATDPGFAEIEDIFCRELALHNPADKLEGIKVVRFQRGNPSLVFSREQVKPKVPIAVELSNDQKLEWDLESLTNRVDQLKRKVTFAFAAVMFGVGIVVHAAAFVIGQTNRTQS